MSVSLFFFFLSFIFIETVRAFVRILEFQDAKTRAFLVIFEG